MRERHFLTCFAALLLIMCVGFAGPALAGRFTVNDWDDSTTSDSDCDETTDSSSDDDCQDGESGPNGDPKECAGAAAQSGSGFLQCLGDQICGEDSNGDGFDVGVDYGQEGNMSTMNFWLDESPGCTPQGANPGPQEEVLSYCFRENGDAIWYASIEVEQPNLVAKIHKFVENPRRTGEILIGINNDLVAVDVGPALQNVDKLNKMVCSALGRDFRVACLDDFWVVYADSLGQTPTVLSLDTHDSGVSTTEIALEPNGGEADVTACSESSEPLLLISPR